MTDNEQSSNKPRIVTSALRISFPILRNHKDTVVFANNRKEYNDDM